MDIFMTGRPTPEGRTRVKLLYVFDLVPRIVDGASAEVVMFKSTSLPSEFVGDAADQLSPSDPLLAQIDAGDVGFVQTEFERTGGESNASFASRAWDDFDVLVPYVIDRTRDLAVEAGAFDRQRAHVSR